jgi:hypothetical protein
MKTSNLAQTKSVSAFKESRLWGIADFDWKAGTMTFDFSQMSQLRAKPSAEEVRINIIMEVERGEISPLDAELKARKMGLDGFSRYPNPSAFTVMEQDVWSLDMALAWIIWRTPEKVEEYWPDSTAKCLGWQAIRQVPQKSGFGARPIKAVSGHQLVLLKHNSVFSETSPRAIFVFGEKPTPEAEQRLARTSAEKALRSALIHSQLTASARECSTDEIVDIPPREWPRLQYDTSTETELFIPPAKIYEPEDVEILYRDVTVFKNDVVRLWSQSGSDISAPIVSAQPVRSQLEIDYQVWLSQQPKSMQAIGRFFLEKWNLDILPIDDASRKAAIAKYTQGLGALAAPGDRTISRFFELVRPWLQDNRP